METPGEEAQPAMLDPEGLVVAIGRLLIEGLFEGWRLARLEAREERLRMREERLARRK
jgi:hypothetical protein